MSSLTRFTDTIYALRFLRLLTMPWNKTDAFKNGVINDAGKVIKPPKTPEEKSSYTIFHRLVFNVKRLMEKIPLGKYTLTKYITALWLLKEKFQISESELAAVLNESFGADIFMMVNESVTNELSPGNYHLQGPALHCMSAEEFGNRGDLVELKEASVTIFGERIYRVYHPQFNTHLYTTRDNLL